MLTPKDAAELITKIIKAAIDPHQEGPLPTSLDLGIIIHRCIDDALEKVAIEMDCCSEAENSPQLGRDQSEESAARGWAYEDAAEKIRKMKGH